MNKKQKLAKRKQKKSRLRLKAKQAALLKNKKVASPKVKAKKPATKKPAKKSVKLITASERQSMIAEAAYFAAESFGFGGDSHGHWLYAEAQIDAGLAKGGVQVRA